VSGPPQQPAPDTEPSLAGLPEITRAVGALLGQCPYPPTALSLRAGDLAVELSWSPPAGQTASGGTHPAADSEPATPAAEVPGVPAGTPGGEVGVSRPAGHYVCAPTVGVFYRAPAPDAPPFVLEGEQVAAGRQLAIVESMKLMIPIEADRPMVVVRVLKDNGDQVEHGERLFELAVS